MAGKKPAKPIAGQNREKGPQLPGTPVKYIAPSKNGALFMCPTCNRTVARGIIYLHDNAFYCKRGCIPVSIAS